jgi:hypothetical protein
MSGRDEEIRRTIQILSRRTKSNPVLLGLPGVGKTAILEGKRGGDTADARSCHPNRSQGSTRGKSHGEVS